MKMTNSDFEHLLWVGKSVLNSSCESIRELFFNKEMYLYEYSREGKTDKGLEILIDDTILVCVFDKDGCKESILYFDHPDDLADCLRYCDRNFKSGGKQHTWSLHNRFLKLFFPDEKGGRFAFVQALTVSR